MCLFPLRTGCSVAWPVRIRRTNRLRAESGRQWADQSVRLGVVAPTGNLFTAIPSASACGQGTGQGQWLQVA